MRVGVVVEHPDAHAAERAFVAAAALDRRRAQRAHRARRRRRQIDGEGRAAADALAVGAHLAAVQERDVAHQREADAQAARAARRRGVGLGEAVEHVRQELRRDADAVVLAPGAARARACFSSETAIGAALRRELDRVREQVGDELLQPAAVAHHHDVRVVGREAQVDLLRRRRRGAPRPARRARSRPGSRCAARW